jgi:hypothetical protein
LRYQKRNAEKEISPVATGEEVYATSTAQAFEKSTRASARPKLFIKMTVLTPFSAS